MPTEPESYADKLQREIDFLAAETDKLIQHCDMDAKCVHLPTITDWSFGAASNGYRPQRFLTLGEALNYALDSHKRPDVDTVLTLLCKAAKGENICIEAQHVLAALCERIAKQYAEVGDDEQDDGVPDFIAGAV